MFHCIGCGKEISWHGKGLLSYTCLCGATTFISDGIVLPILPLSPHRALSHGLTPPHLDNLVGNSEWTSPEKEALIAALRVKGAIWMKECEQCQQDGTLERHRKRLELAHQRELCKEDKPRRADD